MTRMMATVAAALAVALPVDARGQGEPAGLVFSIQGAVGVAQMVRSLQTHVDAVYGVIFGLHFIGPLAVELDYQHAENDVSGLTDVTLKQSGLLGHVRLELGHGPWTPFLYGGVGWVHYDSNAELQKSADRAVVPAGVGLEFRPKLFVVGARGEYQWATSKLAGMTSDTWKVQATVGFQIR